MYFTNFKIASNMRIKIIIIKLIIRKKLKVIIKIIKKN